MSIPTNPSSPTPPPPGAPGSPDNFPKINNEQPVVSLKPESGGSWQIIEEAQSATAESKIENNRQTKETQPIQGKITIQQKETAKIEIGGGTEAPTINISLPTATAKNPPTQQEELVETENSSLEAAQVAVMAGAFAQEQQLQLDKQFLEGAGLILANQNNGKAKSTENPTAPDSTEEETPPPAPPPPPQHLADNHLKNFLAKIPKPRTQNLDAHHSQQQIKANLTQPKKTQPKKRQPEQTEEPPEQKPPAQEEQPSVGKKAAKGIFKKIGYGWLAGGAVAGGTLGTIWFS
jgi:hypothetical protein